MMKEELARFFWIPFSPWPMVFVLAMIGVVVATLIAFAVGNEHWRKIALLIPVVIVVGLFATHAMKVIAGGRAARLTAVLELPDAELKIEPVTIQSVRFLSISSMDTTIKGQVVPTNKVFLSMDEVQPVAANYKTFYPERTAFNGLGSSTLAPKN
jgi:hypothetical protein